METMAENEYLADDSFAQENSRMCAWVALDNVGVGGELWHCLLKKSLVISAQEKEEEVFKKKNWPWQDTHEQVLGVGQEESFKFSHVYFNILYLLCSDIISY